MAPVVDVAYQAIISTGLRSRSCLMEDSGASSESNHNLVQFGVNECSLPQGRLHSYLGKACKAAQHNFLESLRSRLTSASWTRTFSQSRCKFPQLPKIQST